MVISSGCSEHRELNLFKHPMEITKVQDKQRLYISQSIKDGIAASNKRSGRKPGQLDKMSDALREDILKYLSDRSIKQVDLMRKYNISRNTLKKYIDIVEKEIQNIQTNTRKYCII